MTSYSAIIVHEDNDDIKSFADLKGKRSTHSVNSMRIPAAEKYGAKLVVADKPKRPDKSHNHQARRRHDRRRRDVLQLQKATPKSAYKANRSRRGSDVHCCDRT